MKNKFVIEASIGWEIDDNENAVYDQTRTFEGETDYLARMQANEWLKSQFRNPEKQYDTSWIERKFNSPNPKQTR
jgi:hypothetical protein